MKGKWIPNYYLAFLVFLLASCSTKGKIELIYPENLDVINNNMPSMLWKATGNFTSFEIWVNGNKMDSVPGNINSYVAFPMAFGQNSWKIVGIMDGKTTQSQTNTFKVTDSYLDPEKAANGVILREGWKVISSLQTDKNGTDLSNGNIDTKDWASTSVPSTVLTALVQNGIYPNPYIGFNNMFIPDCNDVYNKENDLLKYSHIKGENPWKNHYWFRTSFEVPDSIQNKLLWINIGEINYRAEIWLNGKKLADTSEMVGMERSFRFNISDIANRKGQNYLAIAIFPPDNPGKPDPEPIEPLGDPGTNMADGIISKDYTKWDAIGWDWQPSIRDRDMGITEEIFLQASDHIEISDLYVTSDLNLPDTSNAFITVSVDIINYDENEKDVEVLLIISGHNSDIKLTSNVKIPPKSKAPLFWDSKTNGSLHLKNPKLWWPVGYGNPELYNVKIVAKSAEGEMANISSHFGIRKVETYSGKTSRVYKINGKEIYMKGGNWVMDMMLNWTASRYKNEILLTKNSNLNMLRIWGPTGAPPKAFFNEADKHGILLWQDFLNDYWGTFKNQAGYLPDAGLFEKATIEIVKKYRNHPSLVIWCGGNEGPNPRERLIMEKILPNYDGRDSKHYLKISNGDGLHGGGPYHTIKPDEYFKHHQLTGFSSEIGPSGVPVLGSIRKFITDLGKNYHPEHFPINGQMALHDASDRVSDSRKFSLYDKIIRECYGEPSSVEDYFDKCQLLNYDAYRASIEAINHQLWDTATGIALWKSNSSWPSMTWQIYDWYLQAHAGFYGAKKAAESIHIQLNRHNGQIIVLNSLHKNFEDVKIQAKLYTSDMAVKWHNTKSSALEKNSVYLTGWEIPELEKLSFLQLQLFDKNGSLISENFYWLSPKDDFKSLREIKGANLRGKLKQSIAGEMVIFDLEIENIGNGLAFMTSISLVDKLSGEEARPVIYSDNYISILPGAKKNIRFMANKNDLFKDLTVKCKPYNSSKSLLIEAKR
jgi:hypothetical protein